jgi:hypothetical protein
MFYVNIALILVRIVLDLKYGFLYFYFNKIMPIKPRKKVKLMEAGLS